jgi:predicted dehydrogenase
VERRPEWAAFKGGQMFEMGGHLIDPMLRILGKPTGVQSVLRKHGKYDDALMDNTVAVIDFPSALGIIQSSTLQPAAGPHRLFEVQGTNGTAVIRPLEQPVLEIDLAKAAGPYKAGRQRLELPRYQRYVDDFIELAAVLRGQRSLVVPLEHEIAVNDVLLRASNMG